MLVFWQRRFTFSKAHAVPAWDYAHKESGVGGSGVTCRCVIF
jgi:hypothetical protein